MPSGLHRIIGFPFGKNMPKSLFIIVIFHSFSEKKVLLLHENEIHLKLRPFKCAFRDASFWPELHLKWHEKKFDENLKLFKCSNRGAFST